MTQAMPNDPPLFDAETLDQMVRDLSPQAVKELLGVFMAETRRRLDLAEKAVDDEDLAALEMHTHTIASSAKTFGAPALHQLARNIEDACVKKDPGALKSLPRLRTLVEHSLAATETFALSL